MTRACTENQAIQAKKFLAGHFPDTAIRVIQTGYNSYELIVSLPGQTSGISFDPNDVTNGASGVATEVRRQIQALIEGVPYEPPAVTTFGDFITGGRQVYDDVMTHDRGNLHASLGVVVGGGVIELDESDIVIGGDEPVAMVPDASVEEFLGVMQQVADAETVEAAVAVLEAATASDDEAVRMAAAATLESIADEPAEPVVPAEDVAPVEPAVEPEPEPAKEADDKPKRARKS